MWLFSFDFVAYCCLGEVQEAHLIAALPKDVKHFIQIGDHKQLQPVYYHIPNTATIC